jgi:hypothetical protein
MFFINVNYGFMNVKRNMRRVAGATPAQTEAQTISTI